MIELLFIRHGATEGNLRRRYIGRTDEPLCEAGVAQVKALQKRGLSVDRLFVSPMLRTRQTANILFPKMPYTVVDGFAEMDFGRFEGKAADELSGRPRLSGVGRCDVPDAYPRGRERDGLQNALL